jgi:hypothetical protein
MSTYTYIQYNETQASQHNNKRTNNLRFGRNGSEAVTLDHQQGKDRRNIYVTNNAEIIYVA